MSCSKLNMYLWCFDFLVKDIWISLKCSKLAGKVCSITARPAFSPKLPPFFHWSNMSLKELQFSWSQISNFILLIVIDAERENIKVIKLKYFFLFCIFKLHRGKQEGYYDDDQGFSQPWLEDQAFRHIIKSMTNPLFASTKRWAIFFCKIW